MPSFTMLIVNVKVNFTNSLKRLHFHRFNYMNMKHTYVFNILDNELAEKFCNASFGMVPIPVRGISPLPGNPDPRDRPG